MFYFEKNIYKSDIDDSFDDLVQTFAEVDILISSLPFYLILIFQIFDFNVVLLTKSLARTWTPGTKLSEPAPRQVEVSWAGLSSLTPHRLLELPGQQATESRGPQYRIFILEPK